MEFKDFDETNSAATDDILLLQTADTQAYYRIKYRNLVTSSNWIAISTNYQASSGDRLICLNPLDITLPSNPEVGDEVELLVGYTATNSPIRIYLANNPYKSASANLIAYLKLSPNFQPTKLVYLGASMGWVGSADIKIEQILPIASGVKLWLEGGLNDLSGNGNNAAPLSNSPTIATGINGKPVLRWGGTSNQELSVPYFLAGSTSATLYVVFSVVQIAQHYCLVRTKALDDYWRFNNDGNGYIGTFCTARKTGYPAAMPNSGNHLAVIYASSTNYEFVLDGVSKGLISNTYTSGDLFRISPNDRNFSGDIASLICYPSLIAKGSAEDLKTINYLKTRYALP